MKLKDIKITHEEGGYCAVYKDELGSLVTQGKDWDELLKNLKEAFELHFSDNIPTPVIDFSRFKLNLTTFTHTHAAHLQTR